MFGTGHQKLEWAVSSFPLAGERESGDLYFVQEFNNGALVAVVDGLGHGSEAAYASQRAASVLAKHAGETVISLVRICHAELQSTRGVVMSLASFNFIDESMTWLSIGNVEAILYRADLSVQPATEQVFQRGGVIGYQLPQLRATVLPIAHGDTVILATDGIKPDFADGLKFRDSPQRIADEIGKKYRKENDDSLVLVVRYL